MQNQENGKVMRNQRDRQVRQLTFSALFLGLCMVLPFLTGQIPTIGAMLCPMHIPVMLCGFVCGPVWGMAVGAIAPILRSVLFGMPKLFPSAVCMTFELAAYGALTGIFFRVFPKKTWGLYAALILSMLLGRLVWGLAEIVVLGLSGSRFTMEAFLAGAFVNAVPGIILHILIIPPIVMAMGKAGFHAN